MRVGTFFSAGLRRQCSLHDIMSKSAQRKEQTSNSCSPPGKEQPPSKAQTASAEATAAPARQDSTLTKLSSSSTMPDPEVVQASLMRPSTCDLHDASRSPEVRSMRKVGSGKGQGRVPEEPPQAQKMLNDYLLDCYGRSHRDSPRDRHWEKLAVTPLQSKSFDLQPSPAINTPGTPCKLKQGTRPASQQVSASKSNKRRRQVEQVPTAGVPETQIDAGDSQPAPAKVEPASDTMQRPLDAGYKQQHAEAEQAAAHKSEHPEAVQPTTLIAAAPHAANNMQGQSGAKDLKQEPPLAESTDNSKHPGPEAAPGIVPTATAPHSTDNTQGQSGAKDPHAQQDHPGPEAALGTAAAATAPHSADNTQGQSGAKDPQQDHPGPEAAQATGPTATAPHSADNTQGQSGAKDPQQDHVAVQATAPTCTATASHSADNMQGQSGAKDPHAQQDHPGPEAAQATAAAATAPHSADNTQGQSGDKDNANAKQEQEHDKNVEAKQLEALEANIMAKQLHSPAKQLTPAEEEQQKKKKQKAHAAYMRFWRSVTESAPARPKRLNRIWV